jgi:hypothetical protein
MRWLAVLRGAVLGLALYSPLTQASDWKRLYTVPDRSVEMDLGGIRWEGEVVLAWVRFSYRTEQSDPASGRYRSMLQLWAYQCGLGRHALMQYAEYSGTDGAGQVVASDARSRYAWSYPAPDTIGAAALKLACSRAPMSTVSTGTAAAL